MNTEVSESFPYQEENRRVTERILHIMEETGRLIPRDTDPFGRKIIDPPTHVNFFKIGDRAVLISLNVEYEEAYEGRGVFLNKPKWFSLPVCHFSLNKRRGGGEQKFTTPYGRYPKHVIGADEKIYSFNNNFLFNGMGQGIKYEEVFVGSALADTKKSIVPGVRPEIQRLQEAQEADIERVNFISHPEDSRHVPIEPEEYEVINSLLDEIELGKFKAENYY